MMWLFTIKKDMIIGFIIIICGFAAPFLSGGHIPSTLFFWIGFLLLLRPNRYFPKTASWSKWARIGLVSNILGTLVLMLFVYVITHTSLSSSHFAFIIVKGASFLVNPISTIYDSLFPYHHITMTDGSTQFTVSFVRATMSSFCDVVLYMFLGFALGKIVTSKTIKVC